MAVPQTNKHTQSVMMLYVAIQVEAILESKAKLYMSKDGCCTLVVLHIQVQLQIKDEGARGSLFH